MHPRARRQRSPFTYTLEGVHVVIVTVRPNQVSRSFRRRWRWVVTHQLSGRVLVRGYTSTSFGAKRVGQEVGSTLANDRSSH